MSTQRIDDFGEEIQGARKDAHTRWAEKMREGLESSSRLSQPFSKRWPEPNYATLRVPDAAKRWIRAARDTVGAKPARHRVRGWESRLYVLQRLATELSEYSWQLEQADDGQVDAVVNDCINTLKAEQSEAGNENGARAIEQMMARVKMRENAYEKWGMNKPLRALEFEYRDFDPDQPFCSIVKESSRHVSRRYRSDSIEGLLQQMEADSWVQALSQNEEKPASSQTRRPNVKLEIISYSGQSERGYHIAVKHHREWQILQSFADRASARRFYMDEQQHLALIERYLAWRETGNERNENNADRKGFDWREGRDINPEEFMQTFGFRGVQFGNYVENARRQHELNETYDALLDMAWALDVSPKSLSLNSTLGLAFGARGRGGRNAPCAHYEPNERVINLTKSKGAGSLAHEWFHAFDHYLMTQLKETVSIPYGDEFLTAELTKNSGSHQLTLDQLQSNPVWHEALVNSGKHFFDIKALLDERSKRLDDKRRDPYWSTVEEVGARSFESAITHQLKEQGWQNDYLANILPEVFWSDTPLLATDVDAPPSSYPYPLDNEKAENAQKMMACFESLRPASPIFTERFDQAFSELESATDQYNSDWEPSPSMAMPKEQMGLF